MTFIIFFVQDKFVEYVEKVFFPRIVEKFNKSNSGKSVIDLSKDFRFLDSCQIVTSFCLACFDFVDVNSQQFQETFIKYLKEVS